MNPPVLAVLHPARHPLHAGAALALAIGLTLAGTTAASAATPSVGLGTTAPFAVLAGTDVANTGPSVIDGDLGVSPGLAATGFPPATLHGVQHLGDAVALQARSDLVTAYDDAAGRSLTVDQTGVDLAGKTLTPGVYRDTSGMALNGTVTLDAQGDPDAVFIFQAGSTLITGSGSTVSLIGSAQPCNVYWQVGSSATLGTTTRFVGTILALTSATLQTGASLEGRVLARNGKVSLDDNRITRPGCATRSTTPTATPTATPTPPTATTAAGSKGTKGSKGSKGSKGAKGAKGSNGPKGTQGSQGSGGTSGPSQGSSGTATTGGPGGAGSQGGGSPATPTPDGSSTGTAGPGSPVPSGHPDTGMTPASAPVTASYAAARRAPSTPLAPVALLVAALGLLSLAGATVRVATRRARTDASHRSS